MAWVDVCSQPWTLWTRVEIPSHDIPLPCLLLNPLCHATLNTGIPFVGPLPINLTLAYTHTPTATVARDECYALAHAVPLIGSHACVKRPHARPTALRNAAVSTIPLRCTVPRPGAHASSSSILNTPVSTAIGVAPASSAANTSMGVSPTWKRRSSLPGGVAARGAGLNAAEDTCACQPMCVYTRADKLAMYCSPALDGPLHTSQALAAVPSTLHFCIADHPNLVPQRTLRSLLPSNRKCGSISVCVGGGLSDGKLSFSAAHPGTSQTPGKCTDITGLQQSIV
eukprot:363805-Chlamydomonas_euryale.AAC.1